MINLLSKFVVLCSIIIITSLVASLVIPAVRAGRAAAGGRARGAIGEGGAAEAVFVKNKLVYCSCRWWP